MWTGARWPRIACELFLRSMSKVKVRNDMEKLGRNGVYSNPVGLKNEV